LDQITNIRGDHSKRHSNFIHDFFSPSSQYSGFLQQSKHRVSPDSSTINHYYRIVNVNEILNKKKNVMDIEPNSFLTATRGGSYIGHARKVSLTERYADERTNFM